MLVDLDTATRHHPAHAAFSIECLELRLETASGAVRFLNKMSDAYLIVGMYSTQERFHWQTSCCILLIEPEKVRQRTR